MEIKVTLDALDANARRLLNDAEVIFSHGSHQSAAALSILAIEEVGKYLQVKWHFTDDDVKSPYFTMPIALRTNIREQGLRAHRGKQATVGAFYMVEGLADFLSNAMARALRSIGAPVNVGTINWLLLILMDYINDDEFRAQINGKEIRPDALDQFLKILDNQMIASNRFVDDAKTGIIDAVKQLGFYVDVNSDGTIANDPATMTLNQAEIWIEHARRAVGRLSPENGPKSIFDFVKEQPDHGDQS